MKYILFYVNLLVIIIIGMVLKESPITLFNITLGYLLGGLNIYAITSIMKP